MNLRNMIALVIASQCLDSRSREDDGRAQVRREGAGIDSAATGGMTQGGGYLFLKHSDWVMPSTVFGVIPAKRKAQRNADFIALAIG
jgi:hypothetical protein